MNEKKEYVICSPSYVPHCGGIKSLHALGSKLNKKGYKTYITSNNSPPELENYFIGDLDNEHLKELQHKGIIIYPDIVGKNPAKFTNCVKYFLGVSQPPDDSPNQIIFSFSEMHDVVFKNPDRHLMVWHIEDFFKKPKFENRIKNSCYAGKGGGIDHSAVIELTGNADNSINPSGCIRINASYPHPRTALAQLLQNSKLFISYDNLTILMTEARLCGTPVLLMGHWVVPEEDFKRRDPFGHDGIGFYGEPYDIEELKSQLPKFLERYKQREDQTEKEIDNFIEKTQEWNKEGKYVDDPGNFRPTLNGIKKLAIWGTR